MKDNQEGIKSPFSAGSSSSKLYNYNDNVLNQDKIIFQHLKIKFQNIIHLLIL